MTNLRIAELLLYLGLVVGCIGTTPVISCYYKLNEPPISSINASLCTHIILIGETSVDNLARFQPPNENISKQFLSIKDNFKDVKLLLCVTGGNRLFSKIVSDTSLMKNFALQSYQYITDHGFDGIDLDWEFPAWSSDAKHSDKQNFSVWIKILRDVYGNNKLLTAAVSGPPTITRVAYEVEALSKYLDFIQIMNYDFHIFSYLNPVVGFNAPLRKLKYEPGVLGEMNSEASMRTWFLHGLWRNKTVFGLPTYNRAYLLVNKYSYKPYSPAEYDIESYEKHITVCNLTKSNKGYKYVWNAHASSPYIHGDDKVWISSEDERSMTEKTKYARDLSIAGVMIFHIGADDHEGRCGKGKYPLLNAVHKTLNE